MKVRKDTRLRNRFFRWLGFVPMSDFEYFADDVIRVFEAYDAFSKCSANLAGILTKRMNIDFDGEKDLNEGKYDHNDKVIYG